MSLRKLYTLFFVACFGMATALTLSGCNTLQGAGEDIEAVGDEVQDATD